MSRPRQHRDLGPARGDLRPVAWHGGGASVLVDPLRWAELAEPRDIPDGARIGARLRWLPQSRWDGARGLRRVRPSLPRAAHRTGSPSIRLTGPCRVARSPRRCVSSSTGSTWPRSSAIRSAGAPSRTPGRVSGAPGGCSPGPEKRYRCGIGTRRATNPSPPWNSSALDVTHSDENADEWSRVVAAAAMQRELVTGRRRAIMTPSRAWSTARSTGCTPSPTSSSATRTAPRTRSRRHWSRLGGTCPPCATRGRGMPGSIASPSGPASDRHGASVVER